MYELLNEQEKQAAKSSEWFGYEIAVADLLGVSLSDKKLIVDTAHELTRYLSHNDAETMMELLVQSFITKREQNAA